MKSVKLISVIIVLFLIIQASSSKKDQYQGYDVAAFYWPDYHDDPRLEFIFYDKKGEWQTIYNAKPKEAGERQPRVPLWGYEDESDPKIMDNKINVAVTHGVNVFIFDWYWYCLL